VSTPFCCRTGQANQCTVVATRDDCTSSGGDVQEDKICSAGNCDPNPGSKKITWWEFCPESDTCPGPALTTLDDLIACVDSAADTIVAKLLCIQFATAGPAPAGRIAERRVPLGRTLVEAQEEDVGSAADVPSSLGSDFMYSVARSAARALPVMAASAVRSGSPCGWDDSLDSPF
jgi:hypothetical protein